MEVATGAKTAQSPRPHGIGHATDPVAAGDTGLWMLPTESYDALVMIEFETDAAITPRILVGILKEDLAVVRCLRWQKETSVLK